MTRWLFFQAAFPNNFYSLFSFSLPKAKASAKRLSPLNGRVVGQSSTFAVQKKESSGSITRFIKN
ncbi:hypothetical protein P872_07950 [Rhodonellum psychrophilum GCM71 = DSM 17998]|uniref:Uncharacterized protein n=1 Tax=Rhodonellum psychrophilum GCM71 = DSM 17998 TaxID=1123057 RepID=U5BVN6_9BACT|nr:hypothetical protein P872_07950 [Rhodonellum psychrophilum GCM71 = DSM 17998]